MKSIFSLLFLVASCGCGTSLATEQDGKRLDIKYTKADGTEGHLTDEEKPVVLVYSATWCSACVVQLEAWKVRLQGLDPSSVKVITLLVGQDYKTASDYKVKKKISWEYGADSERTFDSHCKDDAIPCTIVYKPKEGEVYQWLGTTPAQMIERYSGKWE